MVVASPALVSLSNPEVCRRPRHGGVVELQPGGALVGEEAGGGREGGIAGSAIEVRAEKG